MLNNYQRQNSLIAATNDWMHWQVKLLATGTRGKFRASLIVWYLATSADLGLRKSPPPEWCAPRRQSCSAGVGLLSHAQPTVRAWLRFPSREGIQVDFLIHLTPRPSGVRSLWKEGAGHESDRCDRRDIEAGAN